MAEAPSRQLVVGKIGKTHGLKGWVRLNSFTSPPENLLQYRAYAARRGHRSLELELTDARWQGDRLLAHFEGYDDPEAAAELNGLELQIDSASLPALETGEYYWHQLLGLRVRNQQDQLLGRVARLMETGANDVLVVQACAGSLDDRERLIPFLREQVVKSVDLTAQEIEVDWQADYLS